MTRHSDKKRSGFTLIELMVVIAIIGITMSAGIVAFTNIQRRSRDAKRRADVDALAKAVEQYSERAAQYPRIPALFSNDPTWVSSSPANAITESFPSGYPADPTNSGIYLYRFSSIEKDVVWTADKTSRFCVQARLEVPNGNCSGTDFNVDRWAYCNFVTPGTGTYHCAGNRQ